MKVLVDLIFRSSLHSSRPIQLQLETHKLRKAQKLGIRIFISREEETNPTRREFL